MDLIVYHKFPEEFLNIEMENIREVFSQPSLICIQGKHSGTLFLSTLLHGNETASFYVLKKLAKWLQGNQPFQNILIFVGNVWACEARVRHLEHQVDYNRIWDGSYKGEESKVIDKVIQKARQSNLYASIDIHNNTGKNPIYACVNSLQRDHLRLAEYFSSKTVYYTYPSSTQSIAFSEFCPAVTLECGQSGYQQGVEKAFSYILTVLNLHSLDEVALSGNQKVFNSFARIEIHQEASISFDEKDADIMFPEELEKMNFSTLPVGFPLARVQNKSSLIRILGKKGQDITNKFFKQEDGNYILTQTVIPAMLTKRIEIIRQDCLGYLMSEIIMK